MTSDFAEDAALYQFGPRDGVSYKLNLDTGRIIRCYYKNGLPITEAEFKSEQAKQERTMTDDTERKPVLFEWSVQQDPSSWEPEQPVIHTLPHIKRRTGWHISTKATRSHKTIQLANELLAEVSALQSQNALLLDTLKNLVACQDLLATQRGLVDLDKWIPAWKAAESVIKSCEGKK